LLMVHDSAGPLRAVYASVERSGPVATASTVARRFERAERAERESDLREIRERLGRLDYEGARRACVRWASRHPVRESAGPEGLRQAATLLALWPAGDEGPWKTDPRAEVVRFLLEYGAGESAPAMASITSAIPGTPDDMAARAHLRDGDIDGAEEIERNAPASGSPEWLPYYVELVRAHIAAYRLDDAQTALDRISPAARDGCDVLLARRELAASRGDAGQRAASDAAIDSMASSSIQGWTSISPLSICIDPARFGSSVVVDIRTEAPSLITYGWVGGQLGRAEIDGNGSIDIPLGKLQGRRVLFLSPIEPGTAAWKVHPPIRSLRF
jgi:hypothetical protein